MMIFIDYPNGCIMEISCIIDSVLKPTDFLPSKLLVSTEKKKKVQLISNHTLMSQEEGKGDHYFPHQFE